MKRFFPLLLLMLVVAANLFMLQRIELRSTDWNRFFPSDAKSSAVDADWFGPDAQYLFVESGQEAEIAQWQEEGLLERYFSVPGDDTLYLVVFDGARQERLLEALKEHRHGGTSVIGRALMEAFSDELSFFITYVAPVILLLLLWVTSLRYWVMILLEIGGYLFCFELLLVAIGFSVDPPSLLALVFLIIYALTLFNYLHSGEIPRRKLFFGMTVSIVTTALSALFLYVSDFGMIHAFGATMLLGLAVLYVYMAVRLYGSEHDGFPFVWDSMLPRMERVRPLLLLLAALFGLSLLVGKTLKTDLNPLNLIGKNAPAYEEIVAFEQRHLPTLPFVVVFESTGADFTLLPRAQTLAALADAVSLQTGVVVLSGVGRAFSAFASRPLSGLEDTALYDQFILANDMFASGMPVFSSDYKKAYMTLAVPITTSSEAINALVGHIDALGGAEEQIRVEAVGRVADFEHFSAVFVREFLVGIGCSLLLTALFFLWYCRAPKVLLVLAAALFSVAVLFSVHLFFALEVTLLTLLTVILFMGLITDTLVHLFISYKHEGHARFHFVLRPIALSNISMIIGLGGMMLSGSIMRHFALELAVLLASNLFFVLYLMPRLFERYLSSCSAQAGSDETEPPRGRR